MINSEGPFPGFQRIVNLFRMEWMRQTAETIGFKTVSSQKHFQISRSRYPDTQISNGIPIVDGRLRGFSTIPFNSGEAAMAEGRSNDQTLTVVYGDL